MLGKMLCGNSLFVGLATDRPVSRYCCGVSYFSLNTTVKSYWNHTFEELFPLFIWRAKYSFQYETLPILCPSEPAGKHLYLYNGSDFFPSSSNFHCWVAHKELNNKNSHSVSLPNYCGNRRRKHRTLESLSNIFLITLLFAWVSPATERGVMFLLFVCTITKTSSITEHILIKLSVVCHNLFSIRSTKQL